MCRARVPRYDNCQKVLGEDGKPIVVPELNLSFTECRGDLQTPEEMRAYATYCRDSAPPNLDLRVFRVTISDFEAAKHVEPTLEPDPCDERYGHLHASCPCTSREAAEQLAMRCECPLQPTADSR